MVDSRYLGIEELLRQWGWLPDKLSATDSMLVLLIILLVAFAADFVVRRLVVRMIHRITQHTKATWDDLLFNEKVLNHFCHLIPPVIIYVFLPLALSGSPSVLSFLLRSCLVYILLVAMKLVNVFFGVLFKLGNQKEGLRNRPLKGLYQTAQVILYFLGAILIVSVLIDRSPFHLLAGLGASAAILMLVFKDTIMGFVSGIQLSANDMLRPGDWITMPKYGADGTVLEVTLNTVKVRNWDNTITTVPPYALVSDSFQNWRGMSESGGRRIKRSVYIDVSTVHFCRADEVENLLANQLTGTLLHDELSGDIECRQLTNLGLLRTYMLRYIEQLPEANLELTHLVRQLQPTEKGVPLEIYFFCRRKTWVDYERVQSDLFDHILAIVPLFGLRVYQLPGGEDLRYGLGARHGSNGATTMPL